MKFKIVETDHTFDTNKSNGQHKLYQVSLSLSDNEDTLTLYRSYYYSGYDIDELDSFYCAATNNTNNNSHNSAWTIRKLSYITLRYDDKKYLKKQEELLFEKFYEYLLESERNLSNQITNAAKRILLYQDIQQLNEFRIPQRKKKMRKIIEKYD